MTLPINFIHDSFQADRRAKELHKMSVLGYTASEMIRYEAMSVAYKRLAAHYRKQEEVDSLFEQLENKLRQSTRR